MPSDQFQNTEYPQLQGAGPHAEWQRILSARMKASHDGGYFSVPATTYDYNVATSRTDIFAAYESIEAAKHPSGVAKTGDTRFGYGKGIRHFMILVSDKDLFIKFNRSINKGFRWLTANGPLVVPCREMYNLFLRSLDASGSPAAQVQRIDTVAVSSLAAGDYFYMPATNATLQDKVFGIYVTIDGVGTQPTDTAVTQWLALALATGDTNANVATKLNTLLANAAFTGYLTAAVATNQVTVTHAVAGPMADASDGSATTGFTFNSPSTNGTAGAAAGVDLFMV